MSSEPIRVLLIEDNKGDATIILKMLKESELSEFELTHYLRLETGLKDLEKNKYDLILLNLGLPDSIGMESFNCVLDKNPSVPIIILTGLSNEKFGIEAVKCGAQDYLVKGEFNGKLLVRAIQYAIERKKYEGLFIY